MGRNVTIDIQKQCVHSTMWVDYLSIVVLYLLVTTYIASICVLSRGFQAVARNQI